MVTLAPRLASSGDAAIATVDVTLRFEGVEGKAGAPVARLPLISSNVDTSATLIASVDEAMRRASSGKRSPDTLVFAMLALERSGKTTSNADWEALLAHELGDAAVQDFRAFLAGAAPLPDSDAFGPCFRRTTRPMRRYDLGFDSAVLAEPRRIVRGLGPGSAAAAEGLRDGDVASPAPRLSVINGTSPWALGVTPFAAPPKVTAPQKKTGDINATGATSLFGASGDRDFE